jgi:hypothetical protein
MDLRTGEGVVEADGEAGESEVAAAPADADESWAAGRPFIGTSSEIVDARPEVYIGGMAVDN